MLPGTSMGAINAAIIVGSKSDHPEKELEEFWLEIAESSYKIIPDIHIFDYNSNIRRYVPKQISSASINAAAFGLPKMFIPRWWRLFPTKQNLYAENENVKQQPYFTDPRNWTYLYDHSPLAKTLDKYINYKKLNLAANSRRSARGSSPHNNRSKCYDISTAYIRQHQDGNQSKAYSS